jgi:dipeptidyl-peptidase-4
LAPALVACAAASAPHAAELTIDRLFDAPALAGPTIVGLRISPDGSRVTYLQGKAEDKDRLDLWEYDIREGRARILVDSKVLAPAKEKLSDEELGRRERQRTAALSGILEYSFAPSGRALLFPLGGNLYYCDLTKPEKDAVVEINHSNSSASDATISPAGGYVAFVRDQNLHVFDLAKNREKALTSDGGGPIKNGMAEFVAQEEMDRSTGYWWAPDDRHIAFARVDETPVNLTQRFEIAADNVATFAQRYPTTGGPNVLLRLGVTDVHTGAVTWIDLGNETDIYLARVNWLPDGKTLAIQRESRDQKRLDLLFADIDTGRSRIVLTETSKTWIDLHNELSFLTRSHEFVWASSRDGYQHLYLYDYDGHVLRQLTAGAWNVDDFRARAIKGIDEKNRLVYFTATEKNPTERQLYSASLDTPDPKKVDRISHEAGLHSITMSSDATFYVDNFTSSTQPPQVSLYAADGKLLAQFARESSECAASGRALSCGQLSARHRHSHRPRRADAVLPAVQAPALRSHQALPRHRRRLRRPRRTEGPGQLDGQLIHADFDARRLRRVPAGQSRHSLQGYRIPSTDSRQAGRGRSGRSSAGGALARIAGFRRSRTHWRVGLELRRLHDAHADVQSPGCVSRRCCGRARDRLESLRYSLQRALS